MDIIATHHFNKDFSSFWKETKKLNPKASHPVSVGGISEPYQIAELFKQQFKVEPPKNTDIDMPQSGRTVEGSRSCFRFTASEVAAVVKSMKRGKSPGHDSLSIEHLQNAGKHLPRVLAMLFTLCVSHTYLPDEMMKTMVVPIIKNRTGDASDVNNYRPISLATTVAKVLDSVLDKQLDKHISLHDAQFGFRSGHSTETAVLCLKHTVRYYTDRETPVYACFLDLSKAFDTVSYDKLWQKLYEDSSLPSELIEIFRFWYGNQRNVVKWAESLSEPYRLECGVRQGGLSSPRLFSLYVDRLIREISSTMVGCSVDGTFVNNISYADDMVLLGPSVNALNKMLTVCQRYAEAHGLRYNTSKSVLLVFKARKKHYECVPPVKLYSTPLTVVKEFKYLGHWVTDTLSDNKDMERERRALAVRSNMLIRRFARCTNNVKITLFKSYCQSFYTCSLWINYTQREYGTLRVQYNNAFRMMLGLPRHCSASGMFCESRTDGFHAIMRKRVASLMGRLRGSPNSLLKTVAGRLDGPFLQHWDSLHRVSN